MEPITISLSSIKAFGIVMTCIQLFLLLGMLAITFLVFVFNTPSLQAKFKLNEGENSTKMAQIKETPKKQQT